MPSSAGNKSALYVATPLNIEFLQKITSGTLDREIVFVSDFSDTPVDDSKKCLAYWTSLNFPVTDGLLRRFPNLKFILTPTTGLTHISINPNEFKSVEVVSLQGEEVFLNSISATAEHGWGLMLSLWRKSFLANNLTVYSPELREDFASLQLRNRTVGIIGFGRIGKLLASYAKVFGMRIIVFEKYKSYEQSTEYLHVKFVSSVEEIAPEVDVLFLCASVIDVDRDTYPILDADFFTNTRETLVLINTARGLLLDEVVAGQALRDGRIGGLGLDVLQVEDLPDLIDNSKFLFGLKEEGLNIAITPHIGGMCSDAFEMAFKHVWELFLHRIENP
jgi:D-3-phosphoglycerate dehydrogenase / 2-oxoglutarate reductase